jgi:ABC-type sugar transport system substrate-binding protein
LKKVISVLLAIFMLLSLISCAAKEEAATPSASPSAAPASEAPASQAPAEAPAAAADPSVNADEIGFFESGVDPESRDTYQLAWAYPYTLLLFEMMTQTFKQYEDKLNVEITPMTAEADIDKYLINLETYAQQGYDGFLIVLDVAAKERIVEVLDETGLPYVALFNTYRDESGNSLIPTVGTDQYNAGVTTLQWLYDNYKTYWGDIDTTNLGLLYTTLSVSFDLNERAVATADQFKKLFPDNSEMIFTADQASGTGAATDIAYDLASATFAGNPDIKYWFVTCTLEMHGQGIARAVEQLGMEDRVLIVDIGSDILCAEWDTGYDGSWKSCLGMSNYLYAAPAISGLISMLDGKSTPESLWPDRKQPGDVAAFYTTTYEMLTKDTYKDYFNGVAEQAGMELPYKD